MKCTHCCQGDLTPCFLESLFRAHQCDSCNGHWIFIEDYVAWSEFHKDDAWDEEGIPSAGLCESNIDEDEQHENIDDSRNALLCPVTGTIMQKLRINHKQSHRLDYSSAIGGVWLDPGEWELLKKEGLAHSLNAILTDKWQRDIRAASAKDTFSSMYLEKFGEQDYQKLKSMRDWLDSHPKRADIRAYLFAKDPYSAIE